MNIALIFASGKGTRMGTEIPKQFLEINGKPIIVHTVELFQYHKDIDEIYVVTLEEYMKYVGILAKNYNLDKIKKIVKGGDSAQESIYNGLKSIEKYHKDENPIVLLHDGVRPFVSTDVITKNVNAVKEYGSAITCVPAYETVIISENGENTNNVSIRRKTFIGQAPQSFYLDNILSAHEEIRKRPNKYENMVDACTIMHTLGKSTHLVEGNRGNIKVTTPEDVFTFKGFLQYKENEQTFGLGLTNKIGAQYEMIDKSEIEEQR